VRPIISLSNASRSTAGGGDSVEGEGDGAGEEVVVEAEEPEVSSLRTPTSPLQRPRPPSISETRKEAEGGRKWRRGCGWCGSGGGRRNEELVGGGAIGGVERSAPASEAEQTKLGFGMLWMSFYPFDDAKKPKKKFDEW